MGKKKQKKPMKDISNMELCDKDPSNMLVEMASNAVCLSDTPEKRDLEWPEADSEIQVDVFDVPLPDTPQKPPIKKVKRANCETANIEILEAIQELAKKHDATFQKISAIEKTTETTSKHLEKLSSTVQQLSLEMDQQKQSTTQMKSEISKLKAENKTLKASVVECERYSRRWSLKIHGIREEDGEDIRCKVLNILSKVAPDIRDDLNGGVDIVHRIGQRRPDGACRSTIVLFAFRRIRDLVWRKTKGSKFLNDNKLRITEALTTEERAAREKLWPLVKKAREDGKKASFRGILAIIDGKVVNCPENA